MKREYSAGVVVFYQDTLTSERLYLVLHYPKGHWDLPKGKLEPHETALQAALRELHEETGLTVEIVPGFEQALSYMFKDMQGNLVSKQVVFFVGKSSTQQVILSHEHLDYKWLTLGPALAQVTYTNAQQMLRLADEFIENYDKIY
jgi:bis(5'-nucleosidyl)-tetraphosphatase